MKKKKSKLYFLGIVVGIELPLRDPKHPEKGVYLLDYNRDYYEEKLFKIKGVKSVALQIDASIIVEIEAPTYDKAYKIAERCHKKIDKLLSGMED